MDLITLFLTHFLMLLFVPAYAIAIYFHTLVASVCIYVLHMLWKESQGDKKVAIIDFILVVGVTYTFVGEILDIINEWILYA